MKRLFISLCSLVLVPLFVACGDRSPLQLPTEGERVPLRSQAEKPQDLLHVNSVLVIPPRYSQRARDRMSRDEAIYRELGASAVAEFGMEVKSGGEVFKAARKLGMNIPDPEALSLGTRFGTDAVLVTTVNQFIERVGSNIGVTQPATMDFSMSMLRVSDGKEVWKASYHFSDEAISDDLVAAGGKMQTKGGPGWGTADRALRSGFRLACRDFNDKRTAQFVNG